MAGRAQDESDCWSAETSQIPLHLFSQSFLGYSRKLRVGEQLESGEADSFGWVVRSRRGRVGASLEIHELLSQMKMKARREGGGRVEGLEGAR